MHVDSTQTNRFTPKLWLHLMMFEFMARFFSKKPTLSFMFAKRPPTLAAKWMTKVG